MKKLFLVAITVILTLTTFVSCGKHPMETKQGFFFDTVVSISLDKKDIDKAENTFALCSELEDIFSRTKEESELWKLNNGELTTLSPELLEVLRFSLSVSKMSDGAFDVTVAPLSDLWNVKERTVPPSGEEISEALSGVGYENISLSPLNTQKVIIDLGGIAKGYAADKIIEALKKDSVENAIVDLGGNVALLGEYSVGITDPFNPENLYAKIKLKDKSAVTSGAYQRYFDYEGKRYHHIIDPHTGECAASGLASVTVISSSSMEADALSTAIFVLGKDGISLCDKFPGTDALLITTDGEIITTDGFTDKYSLEIIKH